MFYKVLGYAQHITLKCIKTRTWVGYAVKDYHKQSALWDFPEWNLIIKDLFVAIFFITIPQFIEVASGLIHTGLDSNPSNILVKYSFPINSKTLLKSLRAKDDLKC